jgi:hypothetical protein
LQQLERQWLLIQPTRALKGRNRGLQQHGSQQGSQQAGSAQQVGSGAQQVGSGAQQVGSGAQQVGSQQAGSQQAGSQHEPQPPPNIRPNRPAWASLALAPKNKAKAATTGKISRVFMNMTPTKEKQGGDFVIRRTAMVAIVEFFHVA